MLDKLASIIEKYSTDEEFSKKLETQPDVALASYHLSEEETEALREMLSSAHLLRPNNHWW